MRHWILLGAASLGLITLAGCSTDDYPYQPGPVVVSQPGPGPYVVEPGYYYDAGYYDTYGYWHAPAYYYYDGRRYERRDYIPRGYAAHERHEAMERREAHEEHEEHEGMERRGGYYDRDRR